MKKFAPAFIIASLFLPCVSYAQEAEKPKVSELIEEISPSAPASEQNIGTAISPLKKSQFAPFTGVLLSPLAVATLMTELDSRSTEIKIEVDKAVAYNEAKCTYEKSIMRNQFEADKRIFEADITAKKEQIKVLDEALKNNVTSQPNPALWTLLGIATGVVFTTATAAVVVSVSN